MNRILWIDSAKGFAICLVVFGHVLGGAMARGWLSSAGAPEVTYSYIYAFHMPLFFLISGSLAIDSTRANPTRALLSKIGSIAWPYLFWGMTFIALKPVIYRFMLSHPDDSVLQSFRQLLLGEASWF